MLMINMPLIFYKCIGDREMNRTNYLIEVFCISGVIGIISRFLGGIETSYIILLVLVVIDTLTGMAVAIKNKRFNSKGLSKFIKKVVTYSVSIMTVRLLEIGILTLVQTTLLSQIMVAFLEVTETVSILENLTLLGVPIPKNFMSLLLTHLKIPGLGRIDIPGNGEDNLSDIEELIKYQIPTFNDQYIKRLLEINFEVWKSVAQQVNIILREKDADNNELIYYKIMAEIELGFKEIEEKLKEEKIPREYIEEYSRCSQHKVDKWLQKVKSICFSQESIENKKEQFIESLMVFLYQTILSARKGADNNGE
jgi:toxin secretion/phage lysis holin